jgi:hypothetical protein
MAGILDGAIAAADLPGAPPPQPASTSPPIVEWAMPLATNRDAVRAELQLRLAWARDRGHSYDLAVWQLLVGLPEEGLETLRAHLAAGSGAPAHWSEHRPELAVVAGDWERAEQEARIALGRATDRLVPGYKPYVRTLYALIAGTTDAARAQLEELRGYVAGRARLRSGHPASVTEIVEGLLEESAERVASGLDALLAWHLRRARARSEIFNSSRAVVSLEAVVVLLLAHRLGLAAAVAPAYRHASLPLLATHLQEWDGEPLPRSLRLTIQTDLVAGPWLRLKGLDIGDPPPVAAERRPSATRRRRVRAEVGEQAVRESLRERVRARRGSAWQLASWALMLGDPGRGRTFLTEAAAAARHDWERSVPRRGTIHGLGRRPSLPNQNAVREHFALALVLGDDASLRRTSDLLRAWDETAGLERPYAHSAGYLDLIRHLLEPRPSGPTRGDAEQVAGPLASLRVACAGLVDRDTRLVGRGLGGILREHADALERRTSPDAPVCAPAIHVAVAAERLGIDFEVDGAVREYEVPIVVPELGHEAGRLACDLLGAALWRPDERRPKPA